MEEHDENSLHSDTNTEHGESHTLPVSGQVMDVTAPQNSADELQTPLLHETPGISENDNSQSSAIGQSTTESSSSALAIDPPAPQAESSPDVSSTETPNEQPPLGTHEQPVPEHKPAHHGMPVIAIAIAVVVAIILAGIVVMAYTRNNSGDIDRKDTTGINQPIEEKPQATTTDVDDATKEIDDALVKTDDAADFPEAELSDTSLGL